MDFPRFHPKQLSLWVTVYGNNYKERKRAKNVREQVNFFDIKKCFQVSKYRWGHNEFWL